MFYKKLCKQLGIEYKKDTIISELGRASRVYICNTKECRLFLDYIYKGKKFGFTRKYNKYIKLKNFVKIHKSYTSKYLGVHFRKDTNRWQARCRYNNNEISLGCYDSQLKAARVRDQFVVENRLNKNYGLKLNFKI